MRFPTRSEAIVSFLLPGKRKVTCLFNLQIVFKNFNEMKGGEKVSRRLLLRAADRLARKLNLKISPCTRDCFATRLLAEQLEMVPGGTLQMVVEFTVPENVDGVKNFQVFWRSEMQ